MPTFKANLGYELIREDINHVWGQGWFTSREYHGTKESIAGLMLPLARDGWEWDMRNEGSYYRLTATRQAQPNDPETDYYDRFTVSKETIEKDIWTLDEIYTEVNNPALYGGDLQIMKDSILVAIEEGDESKLDAKPQGVWPMTWAVYTELSRGVESYEEEYTVLTRERVVSVLYGEKLALPQFTAGTIYTTAQLRAAFGIPDLIGVAWPVAPAVQIPDTQWGWRSRRRDVQFQEGQKVQITEDWAWAAWSTNIYASAA